MRKLWGRTSSSNVMKVLWLMEELALPYERIDAGGAFGRTKEPEYRAMNPMGLVPSLQEEDGWALWESNTICRYLCNTEAPDSPLYPRDARQRATVETWMDWTLGHLTAPMVTIFLPMSACRNRNAIGRRKPRHAMKRASFGRLWTRSWKGSAFFVAII
jgi:glutathione S-transferase